MPGRQNKPKPEPYTASDDFKSSLIDQVRRFPSIWDPKHKDHYNLGVKLNAWMSIVVEMKHFDENLTGKCLENF